MVQIFQMLLHELNLNSIEKKHLRQKICHSMCNYLTPKLHNNTYKIMLFNLVIESIFCVFVKLKKPKWNFGVRNGRGNTGQGKECMG